MCKAAGPSRTFIVCAALFLLGAAEGTNATVYQCKGTDGSMVYSDVPCSPDAHALTEPAAAGGAPTSATAGNAVSPPQISRALYGSPRNGQQLDVTAALASRCRGTASSCQVSCNNQLAGDPDLGQRKYCKISYHCSGDSNKELQIQEGETGLLTCSLPAPRGVSPRLAVSATHPQVDPKSLHCGISMYVAWIRSQTQAPTPEAKTAKLQEIDDQCGSSLHLTNVQTSYDVALNNAHLPHPTVPATPPATTQLTSGESASAAPTPPSAKQVAQPKTVGEFPVVPEKNLPALKEIPQRGTYAVEVGESFGRPNTQPMTYRTDITIFDLKSHKQYRWDLPRTLLDGLAPTGSMHRAAWAPKTSELLFAKLNEAYVVSRAGQVRALHLLMPGHLKPFDGIETYAMSFDGQSIAYYLYTRDVGDLQSDGFGKLYVDLMVEGPVGSTPVTIMREQRPSALAWSPDGGKIAYATYRGEIVILSRSGKTMISVRAIPKQVAPGIGPWVADLKWRPNGEQLGILVANQLYVMDGGGVQTRVTLNSPGLIHSDMRVNTFAWSPDGRRIVFRSPYDASEKCNYRAVGYKFDTGSFPCIHGSNLFVGNADGTSVSRITEEPDYAYASTGELFWVQ